MTEEYEAIGVILRMSRKGKFSAHRVCINDDKIVKEELLTSERAASWAVKEARESLDRIISDWMHEHTKFAQPKQLAFKLEDK